MVRLGVKFYRYGQRKSERGLSLVGVEGEIIERLSEALLGERIYGTSVEYGLVPHGDSYFRILEQEFIVTFDDDLMPEKAFILWVNRNRNYIVDWNFKRITRENIIRELIRIMAKEILGM